MAITQAICDSFILELHQKAHDLTNDTFKIALYTSSASLSAATTAYSTTNEITGTGYTAGGATLAVASGFPQTTTNGHVIWDFDNASWSGATITARAALIYNSTNSNTAVCVLDFGADVVATAETLTISFPAPDENNAILRATH